MLRRLPRFLFGSAFVTPVAAFEVAAVFPAPPVFAVNVSALGRGRRKRLFVAPRVSRALFTRAKRCASFGLLFATAF